MKITRKNQLKVGDIATIPPRFCIAEHRGKKASIQTVGTDSGWGLALSLRFSDGSILDCTTDDIAPNHFVRPEL